MAVWHQCFLSKWPTSIQAMTLLHGGATNGLKSKTHPDYLCKSHRKMVLLPFERSPPCLTTAAPCVEDTVDTTASPWPSPGDRGSPCCWPEGHSSGDVVLHPSNI